MTQIRRHMLTSLLSILCAYSLYRHFIPLDLPLYSIYTIRVVLAVMAIGLGSCLRPILSNFVQSIQHAGARVRLGYFGAWLLLTLCLFASGYHLYPLQPIALEISAPVSGSGVTLKAVYVDEQYLRPPSFTDDNRAWRWTDRVWIAKGGATGALKWHGLARSNLKIVFSSGPQAGEAIITVNGSSMTVDLNAPNAGEQHYAIPAYPATKVPLARHNLNLFSDFLCASFLAGLVLAGGRILVISIFTNDDMPPRHSSRRWLIWLAAVVTVGGAGVVLFNYWVDPLQFYRLASYESHWSKEQRYQNPGLAKHSSYDTVLLGASTIEQYLQSEVTEQLGTPTLKLAVRGGSLYEQRRTLEVALATGKPHRVIWVLDLMALCGPPERVAGSYWGVFPDYMYDQNPVNDIEYLFNYSTTANSAAIIGHRLRLRSDHTDTLDMLSTWYGDVAYGKPFVLKSYNQLQDRITQGRFSDIPQTRKLYDPKNYTLDQLKATIDYNILPLMARYPDVEFDFVFGPYPVYFYLLYYQQDPRVIQDWLLAKEYLLNKMAGNQHVTVHDFQDQEEYLLEFDHYYDTMHFDQTIGRQLLTHIKTRSHVVTPGTIDVHNRKLLDAISLFSHHGMSEN